MAQSKLNSDHEEIAKYAQKFAEITARNVDSLLKVKATPQAPQIFNDGSFTKKTVWISILFTGTAFGEFIVALNEDTAHKMLGRALYDDTAPDLASARQRISETFCELLNMIAGESLVALARPDEKYTITPPKIYFGEAKYPRVTAARVDNDSDCGPFECLFYIDKMKLDIASSYKGALESLTQAHDQLQAAYRYLQDQQEVMAQSEKLAALGVMAGGVAHELNTPLTTISLVNDQMRGIMTHQPIDALRATKMIDTIAATVSRISTVTTSLRVYASHMTNVPIHDTTAHELINEAATLYSAKLAQSECRLTLKAIDPNLRFECRRAQLAQVLFHLVTNSLDAVSTLPPAERWVEIEALSVPTGIEIRITDSGKAIPAEIRKKIFDPFFTTKAIGAGKGLGLAYAKGILDAHHGEVLLNSAGAHTQFIVRLPLKMASEKKVAL